jgi:predicted NBD/HSP70 family sugar kinase
MLGVKTPALPASLRRTNQRTVISLLLRLGSASRADLAKAAGISQPTAGKITTELLKLGVLQEAGLAPTEGCPNGEENSPRLGRPGHLLRLDDEHPRFVAIELGVSETCISALPVAVLQEDRWAHRFATPKSPEAWLKELKAVSRRLPRNTYWGVLVSVPGMVDEAAGKVLFAPNLHWLESADLPRLIGQVWRAPVLLVQEIRALALGHLTAEPGSEDFFLVDFGQGVGGAIVLDGKLYEQPLPLSGELGHTPIAGNRRRCGCGNLGCLETLISQRGLLQSFGEKRSSPKSALSTLDTQQSAPSPTSWTSLVSHANNHRLEPWLTDALNTTGKVIAGVLNVLGIQRVIVTGILNELPDFVVKHLADEIRHGSLWTHFGDVACQSAPHRRAAGLVAIGLDRLVLPANDEIPARFPQLEHAR